jgi:hypothetical protein
MNDALLSLTEAIRIARLEDDDQCRGSAEGTIKRLAEMLWNKDIDAAIALIGRSAPSASSEQRRRRSTPFGRD